MAFTVLFDLDDTLLQNEKTTFIKAYFRKLATFAESRFGNSPIISRLNTTIELMVSKKEPDLTLQIYFEKLYFPFLSIPKNELLTFFDDFYTSVFPELKQFTNPNPGAKKAVEMVLEKGGNAVIATNPLFPRVAVLQRLEWAGLPADKYPFKLITSYENMHFAKPHPEYYAEILGQLGWPEGPVLMVGDDLENDLIPATEVGFLGYWLHNQENEGTKTFLPGIEKGGWGEFSIQLARLRKFEGIDNDFKSTSLCPILAATPAALDTMVSTIAAKKLTYQPKLNEWSITEILCHLRDVDLEVNSTRVLRILQEENPFIAGENTDLWAIDRAYQEQDGRIALKSFMQSRNELINMVRDLPPEKWNRTARHAIFGKTSLSEIIHFIITHDKNHIQQISSVIKNL